MSSGGAVHYVRDKLDSKTVTYIKHINALMDGWENWLARWAC